MLEQTIGSIGVLGWPIECAQSSDFVSFNIDGILGLAPMKLDHQSPNPQKTWLAFILPLLDGLYLSSYTFYSDILTKINSSPSIHR